MGTATTPDPPVAQLLEEARRGGEDAFRRLVDPLRGEIYAHCYRMLGSVHDAEDAMQDVLLRAWRGLALFDEHRALRPWLYKIATNACIDAAGRRPRRMLPIDAGPPGDSGAARHDEWIAGSAWVEPYPADQLGMSDGASSPEARYEQREAVELAFIAALQHLPARQRAVLVLREVLGFSAKEVAEMLDSTPASANSALQRARKTIDERLPESSQQATLRALGDERLSEIVERFVDAFESGEVEAILAMLTDDATVAMPPYPTWYRGRDAVSDSWLVPDQRPTGLRCVPTRASGQLAVAVYRLDQARGVFEPLALDVITLEGPRVAAVTAFRTPELFARFGLPESLPA